MKNLERKKKEQIKGRTNRRKPIFNPTIQLVVVSLYTKYEVSIFSACGDIFDEKFGKKEKGTNTRNRVPTEIGNLNSRTFPGLFKDYLQFFQESFFIDSNSPNTAYTQDFCPIQDCKRIFLSSSLFLPDFSSAYCLPMLLSFLPFPISALQGFTSGCIRFVLLNSNRIE